LPKLGEPVKKVQDSGAKLALGAVEAGVDNLLAQVFPEALKQVQIGRIGQQKHLADGLVGQPRPQGLVFVVASIVANDVNAGLTGVGGQYCSYKRCVLWALTQLVSSSSTGVGS
jgi:hypothetical protein